MVVLAPFELVQLAPSEPVQLAPSELVPWPLEAVQEQCPPLEGIEATAVMVVVVVVVLVVHVAMFGGCTTLCSCAVGEVG